MAHLDRIFVYPFKSLDGVELERAELTPGGALAWDRRFALFDARDRIVNAKRTAALHALRARFDLDANTITLSAPDRPPVTCDLHDRRDLDAWLGAFFGQAIVTRENPHGGFPDDTAASGPTIISAATLAAVAAWFPELTVASLRDRLRANLELADVPAFWEDCLFAADRLIPFQVGPVTFEGVNPCQRCIVPARDPATGRAYPNFQRTFGERRRATLPTWTDRRAFDHFYRLSVNTRTRTPGILTVGDRIEILEPRVSAGGL